MATKKLTVDTVVQALEQAGDVHAKRLFGEYILLCDGREVGVFADDRLFLKATAEGRKLLPELHEGIPFKGAEGHFLIPPEWWEDEEAFSNLVRTTARHLPLSRRKTRGALS